MRTLTSRNKYWPLVLLTLLIFGLIFLGIAMIFRNFLLGLLFVAVVFGILARKIVRELTWDGARYGLSYMQWGRLRTVSLDAADVNVFVVSTDMGRGVWRQSLKITDRSHRLLYDIRTGDGFDIADLKAFAGAVQS